MEKNIPIDQLFQQKLGQGEEQLNLGAWANMERLLDGKNPYSEVDETKKKRRILPFLAFFILISGALTAGYISITKKPSTKNDKVAENTHAPIVQSGVTETISSTNTTNNTQNVITPKEASLVSENSTENVEKNIANNVEIVPSENSNSTKNNNVEKLVQTSNSTKDKNKSQKNLSSNEEKNAIQNSLTKTDKNNHSNNNNNTIIDKNSTSVKISTLPKIAKKEIIKDTISLIEIQEKKTAKNSSSKSIEYDTVGRYNKVVEKLVDVVEEEVIPVAKAKVVNPRLVNLSPEEEINASKKIELKSNKEVVAMEKTIVSNPITTSINKETKSVKSTSSDNGYSNSIFNKMKEFSNKMAMKRVQFYPGMSVGINAAFFNTEHNFGGFHFGLNNLIPVSNYFSILSELKIFYKKNSGYSVNDKSTFLFDYNADAISLASQNKTIHTTTIDSSTKKYNFNSYSTMELPILLQAHFGKVTPYIGANISYAFKLKTTIISKNYAVLDTLILDNSVPFTTPSGSSYVFAREDFGSRFGIGYTIGASYTINPNLYVDLRLSNVLKDNAKTLSAREISDGIFRVPFMQFSIGYRFKKFSPNN